MISCCQQPSIHCGAGMAGGGSHGQPPQWHFCAARSIDHLQVALLISCWEPASGSHCGQQALPPPKLSLAFHWFPPRGHTVRPLLSKSYKRHRQRQIRIKYKYKATSAISLAFHTGFPLQHSFSTTTQVQSLLEYYTRLPALYNTYFIFDFSLLSLFNFDP